jgi:hypothetical protein
VLAKEVAQVMAHKRKPENLIRRVKINIGAGKEELFTEL